MGKEYNGHVLKKNMFGLPTIFCNLHLLVNLWLSKIHTFVNAVASSHITDMYFSTLDCIFIHMDDASLHVFTEKLFQCIFCVTILSLLYTN